MTFGSLFAGIGGLDLGLERAGMECRWQVEIDPFCRQVLTKHWPKVPKYGDITKLTGEELESVQLICGGFPCQDLSQAGKRTGIEGSRSGLWFDFARIIRVVGPRYVLIENVPGLLVRSAMRRVVGELARLGYVGWWRSLRASQFGASHLRKRIFIVAHSKNDDRRAGLHRELRPGWTQTADRSSGNSGNLADGKHQRRIVSGEAYDRNGHHASGNHTDGCDPIVANAGLAGHRRTTKPEGLDRRRTSGNDRGTSGALADARNGQLPQPGRRPQERDGAGSGSAELDHPQCARLEIRDREREQQLQQGAEPIAPGLPAFAPGPADPRWPTILAARPDLAPALKSPVRGMADGLPGDLDGAMSDRTKRLGRLGNAVVPQVAEWIGRRILEIEAQA